MICLSYKICVDHMDSLRDIWQSGLSTLLYAGMQHGSPKRSWCRAAANGLRSPASNHHREHTAMTDVPALGYFKRKWNGVETSNQNCFFFILFGLCFVSVMTVWAINIPSLYELCRKMGTPVPGAHGIGKVIFCKRKILVE